MPEANEDHLYYLKEKGKYLIDSKIKNLPAFSDEMIEILEKYGHWFQALVDGELEPITERQKMFVEAVKNDTPFSVEEQAWVLFQKRKNLEKGLKDALKRRTHVVENPFYAREDVEELKGQMFRVNINEHPK